MNIDELVKKAQMGNDGAFCELINEYKIQLYKIAFAYFKNENDALEAVQEATFRAYRNIKKLKYPQYFKTWLIRILMNYCTDEKKRKNKWKCLIVGEGEIDTGFDENKIELHDLVYRLEPKYRQIIILKYFEDLTIKEVAEIMERPEGTIKTWLNQALKDLRLMIGEEE